MLRVMIVDDEEFILEMLCTFFDWSTIGVAITATASNGKEALEKLHETAMDIVFTDVKMPVMDGLELVSVAQEYFPDTQFIMLSSYSEFEIVKKAFKLGSIDYALKSEITPEQITALIAQAKENIRKKEQEKAMVQEQKDIAEGLKEKINRLSTYERVTKDTVLDNLFTTAIRRNWDFVTLQRQAQLSNITLSQQPTLLLRLQIDNYKAVLEEIWLGEEHMLSFAISNVLKELLEDTDSIEFQRGGGVHNILFFGVNTSQSIRQANLFTKDAQAAFEEFFLVSIVVSIDSLPEEATLSMREQATISAMKSFFIQGKENLLIPPMGNTSVAEDTAFDNRLQAFTKAIQMDDYEGIQENINDFQIDPTLDYRLIDGARALFLSYHNVLEKYLSTEHSVQEQLEYFEVYLAEYGTLRENNRWLKEIIALCVRLEFQTSSLVRRAQQQILANYSSDISLASIAEELGVNANYLSRVFSKESALRFTEYLNKIRIEAAIDLMEKENYKLYELAEKVGYNNVEHFSRVFKTIMGTSPRNYFS